MSSEDIVQPSPSIPPRPKTNSTKPNTNNTMSDVPAFVGNRTIQQRSVSHGGNTNPSSSTKGGDETMEDGGVGNIGSRVCKRGRHRRVLSAVEGSAAQEILLTGLGGFDFNALGEKDVVGGTIMEIPKNMDEMNTLETDEFMTDAKPAVTKTTNDMIPSTSDETNVEVMAPSNMTISTLSQWNNAAQSKASAGGAPPSSIAATASATSISAGVDSGDVEDVGGNRSISPTPDINTSTHVHDTSVLSSVTSPIWDSHKVDDGDADGLILRNGEVGTEVVLNSTNVTSSHHHFPIVPVVPITGDNSSVGATAAFSNSSQRSIMSAYSSELEEEEEEEIGKQGDDNVPQKSGTGTGAASDEKGEEGDLMGELLSARKGKEVIPSCKNCKRMQQIEHQRRMQKETEKISSRTNMKRQYNNTNPIPKSSSQQSTNTPHALTKTSLLMSVLQSELQDAKQEIQSQNQMYFEKMLSFLQSETQKRNAIEHRLHSQLLWQSESMVAMELKLLRLEAKVERREKQQQQQQINQLHQWQQQLGQQQESLSSSQQYFPQQQPRRGSSGRTGMSSSGVAVTGGATNSFRRMASPSVEVETDGFPLENTMILANVEEAMEDDEDDSDESQAGRGKRHSDDDDDDDDADDEDDDNASGLKQSTRGRNKKVLKKIVATASSAASLVSAVTAMSGDGFGLEEEDQDGQGVELEEEDEEEEGADTLTLESSIIERTNPGTWNRSRGRNREVRAVVTGIATEDDGSDHTPTQSSNRNIPSLESILLNPIVLNNSVSNISLSESVANTTKAIRSPPDVTQPVEDENSTLATSVTSATWTSTVVTGATSLLNANTSRGGSYITGAIGEHSSYTDNTHEDQSSKEIIHISLKEEEDDIMTPHDRGFTSSPLTVPSMSGMVSTASSHGSVLATGSVSTAAAIAPSRDFRSRRALASKQQTAGSGNFENAVIPSHVKTGDIKPKTDTNSKQDDDEEEDIVSPRSRSNSPLTLPSMSGINSVAAISVGGNSMTANSVATLGTTAAVAPSRDFRSRRAVAAAQLAASAVNERAGGSSTSMVSQPLNLSFGGGPRPLTNRVVSFVSSTEETNMNENGPVNMEGAQVVFTGGTMVGGGGIVRGEMDSLTVPDELDNLSDIDAAFASTSARWREEYEARLDAIQKRLS